MPAKKVPSKLKAAIKAIDEQLRQVHREEKRIRAKRQKLEAKRERLAPLFNPRSDEIDENLFYYWEVRIGVNAVWVADGFNLDAERLHTMVNNDLAYARTNEIEAEILVAPPADAVARQQGYKSAADEAKREQAHKQPERAIDRGAGEA